MRHADRPAGPNTPTRQRVDAVDEQEELDELQSPTAVEDVTDLGDTDAAASGEDGNPAAPDPIRSARHAERDAAGPSQHTARGLRTAEDDGTPGGDRR